MYVWNLNETEIKISPTKHSKTLKSLKLGEQIQIAHFAKGKSVQTIHSSLDRYPMSHNWILVKIEGNWLMFSVAVFPSEDQCLLINVD